MLSRLKALLAQEERVSRLRVAYHLRDARVGSNARIVGRPYVRCRDLTIGDDFLLWSDVRATVLEGTGSMSFGDRCFVNVGVTIVADESVRIGSDVAIGHDAFVIDTGMHGLEGRPPTTSPVTIGDGAWVAARAMVLPGVTVGSRSVVAAGSIVTRDVPDDTLVAGSPAVVVRTLDYPPGVTRAWTDSPG